MAQKAVKPLGLSKNKGIFRRELPFYLMLIPGVLFALVFSYGPMFGLVMAFQDFTPLKSFENSPWVGLAELSGYACAADVLVGGAQYIGNLSQ